MQEEYTKEFEEKKTELQPKVIEIYEASSTEIKVICFFSCLILRNFLLNVIYNFKHIRLVYDLNSHSLTDERLVLYLLNWVNYVTFENDSF